VSAALARRWDVHDVERLKAEFPALCANCRPLHYLDNAATTQKPAAVIEAVTRCLASGQGSVHRGIYPLADAASEAYEGARDKVARFIGARNADELVFSRSATESINMVAEGWLKPRLGPGDRVWVTRMEHHANFLPWQRVCLESGAELCIVELHEDGRLDLEGARDLFDDRTRMIALCQISNVLGVENPVEEVCRLAASAGIPVFVDAAQSVPHRTVDVTELGCDFLAFSAHKLYGPGGIGALYGRRSRLEEMEPLLVGGGMVDRAGDKVSSWVPPPGRFEAGSPNLAGALGFDAAVDWITEVGMAPIQAHLLTLTRQAMAGLCGIPGLRLLTPPHAGPISIVTFDLEGVHPHDVAQVAGERGVALRAGHHCCQPLMRHLGLAATVRASFAVYNDAADVAALIDAVDAARRLFR
jgi:cysteine desulfurase/selenocysteine lyase